MNKQVVEMIRVVLATGLPYNHETDFGRDTIYIQKDKLIQDGDKSIVPALHQDNVASDSDKGKG